MSRGVVLVRSPNPDVQLQALRTALSLSLGDRQADLLVGTEGATVLAQGEGTEAAHCLQTIRQVGLRVELDGDALSSPVHREASVLPHEEFVQRLAAAEFVQVF